jgi:hypothetical protein
MLTMMEFFRRSFHSTSMIQIDRSALVGYRAQDIYAIAHDSESYPQIRP